jgi:hypothetical protein
MNQSVKMVVLALHHLGGASRLVDTEDVAIKTHELAPGWFAWKKYPERVNLELVRVALSDGKKKANGVLVEGSGRKGWRLSPEGIQWIIGNRERLESADLSRERTRGHGGGIDEQRWRIERSRVTSTNAWVSWKSGGPISSRDAMSVFRIDTYSLGKLGRGKVTRLVEMFSRDRDVLEFLSVADAALPSEGPSDEQSAKG